MKPETRASQRLISDKEQLARAITRALYEALPELTEKYGEVGRQRCLEDMRYNLEHLAPAVELNNPPMFAAYVQWLEALLRARHVATSEVERSLELIEREIRARFPAEEAELIATCIRAGIAVLAPEASS
jgi:hypothetical protein